MLDDMHSGIQADTLGTQVAMVPSQSGLSGCCADQIGCGQKHGQCSASSVRGENGQEPAGIVTACIVNNKALGY
jgi:hypothetical protein